MYTGIIKMTTYKDGWGAFMIPAGILFFSEPEQIGGITKQADTRARGSCLPVWVTEKKSQTPSVVGGKKPGPWIGMASGVRRFKG